MTAFCTSDCTQVRPLPVCMVHPKFTQDVTVRPLLAGLTVTQCFQKSGISTGPLVGSSEHPEHGGEGRRHGDGRHSPVDDVVGAGLKSGTLT